MISDTLLFVLMLLLSGALLFVLVYFVITLSDLECDYLNAQQCCSKLNIWIIPKMATQVVMNTLFLLYGHWILFFVNLPLSAWLVYEMVSVPLGNTGVYDPAEIHNRGQLKRHMRDCMIYLGYYLIAFFIYLYCMIISMLQNNPIPKPKEDFGMEF